MKDEPAFPSINPDSVMVKDDFKGLTKREYFAGQIVAASVNCQWSEPEEMAEKAVLLADALLTELEAAGDPLAKDEK